MVTKNKTMKSIVKLNFKYIIHKVQGYLQLNSTHDPNPDLKRTKTPMCRRNILENRKACMVPSEGSDRRRLLTPSVTEQVQTCYRTCVQFIESFKWGRTSPTTAGNTNESSRERPQTHQILDTHSYWDLHTSILWTSTCSRWVVEYFPRTVVVL